ncbi:hypothetical protein HK101_010198 [Irineochytrium annulatum]|nr:hypothetical protein HK101_010198 [Irineochytrium annulatum]
MPDPILDPSLSRHRLARQDSLSTLSNSSRSSILVPVENVNKITRSSPPTATPPELVANPGSLMAALEARTAQQQQQRRPAAASITTVNTATTTSTFVRRYVNLLERELKALSPMPFTLEDEESIPVAAEYATKTVSAAASVAADSAMGGDTPKGSASGTKGLLMSLERVVSRRPPPPPPKGAKEEMKAMGRMVRRAPPPPPAAAVVLTGK